MHTPSIRALAAISLFVAIVGCNDGGSSDSNASAQDPQDDTAASGSSQSADSSGEQGSSTVLPDPNDPLPFSTTRDYLTVKRDGEYRKLFIKGMTVGTGLPGAGRGELPVSREHYLRWFDMMRELGVNSVRVYRLHPPQFYSALDEHNRQHPGQALYLMQGVRFPENANASADLYDLTDAFSRRITQVVDCLHGNCSIAEQDREAFGEYNVNVSRWLIAWVIGREIYPNEVQTTNREHSGDQSYYGEAFRVQRGQPVEVWYARHLDNLITYERDTYGSQRPVSVQSWPTLDPIEHETEGSDYSNQDIASFDISLIEPVDAPGGIFATYHAYPYYPNFIPDDPGYREYSDSEAPNSYLGYLTELRSYHSEIPLFIGETGVPSSWGNAHWGYQGMNHGGHTEREQGEAAARLFRTIQNVGSAGGAFFSWIDEWWKSTWITAYVDYPEERRKIWHNVVTPEQNFGLLAFDTGEPDFGAFQPVSGQPPVDALQVAVDASYFHVRLSTQRALTGQDSLVIGFDTYRDDLGESQLPDNAVTQRRNEFALIAQRGTRADWHVTLAYDLRGRRFGTSDPGQQYRSTVTQGAPWRLMRWQNSAAHGSNDGRFFFEPTFHDVGRLGFRSAGEASSSHDAVVFREDGVDIRIPWTLLYFVDPSQREVVHDDRDNPPGPVRTATSGGIAMSVSLNAEVLFETSRQQWAGWNEAPATTERRKAGMAIFGDALSSMPDWVD